MKTIPKNFLYFTGNKELVQSLIFDAIVTEGFDGNQGGNNKQKQ